MEAATRQEGGRKHKEKVWNHTSENQVLLSWVGTSEERVPWSWFCKDWENRKLGSAAPTRRSCHRQGEESVAAMTLTSRSGSTGGRQEGASCFFPFQPCVAHRGARGWSRGWAAEPQQHGGEGWGEIFETGA